MKITNIEESHGDAINLNLKEGMAFLIVTDKGPSGVCGQSMSITCPHCVIHVWNNEDEMRLQLKSGFPDRNGRQRNEFYGVIGEWSTGKVVFHDHRE